MVYFTDILGYTILLIRNKEHKMKKFDLEEYCRMEAERKAKRQAAEERDNGNERRNS